MSEPARKPSSVAKNRSARLMAVQAVYQIIVNAEEPALVVNEYLGLRKSMVVDGETMTEPDEALFRDIVLGLSARREDIEGIVAANRPVKDGSMRAAEPLLQAVLLCGAYELFSHRKIDAPVIISSYVDVAKAFFTGAEPSLVNAVLDSIQKVVRN